MWGEHRPLWFYQTVLCTDRSVLSAKCLNMDKRCLYHIFLSYIRLIFSVQNVQNWFLGQQISIDEKKNKWCAGASVIKCRTLPLLFLRHLFSNGLISLFISQSTPLLLLALCTLSSIINSRGLIFYLLHGAPAALGRNERRWGDSHQSHGAVCWRSRHSCWIIKTKEAPLCCFTDNWSCRLPVWNTKVFRVIKWDTLECESETNRQRKIKSLMRKNNKSLKNLHLVKCWADRDLSPAEHLHWVSPANPDPGFTSTWWHAHIHGCQRKSQP